MKKLIIFLLVVVLGVAGVVYWMNAPALTRINKENFTYAITRKGDLTEAISATGIVQPVHTQLITSELPGKVIAVKADVNQTVYEGQELLELDAWKYRMDKEKAENGVATAKAGLLQAQAAEEAARLAYTFQLELSKGGAGVELGQAKAKLNAAKAGVAMASAKLEEVNVLLAHSKAVLEMAKVRVMEPPASELSSVSHERKKTFIILKRDVFMGQMVGPAAPKPLFVLATNLDVMEVHAQIAEGDIGLVKIGQKARITLATSTDTDNEFFGEVKEIRPTPTNVQGAVFYDTVIKVNNVKNAETGEWRLRPGMTMSVDILRRTHIDVWQVPTAALSFRMAEPYQSIAAQKRLAEWSKRPDAALWKAVWVYDEKLGEPKPIFVRIGGTKNGDVGIKDGGFNEVLEWEPGLEPLLENPYRLIINAPPTKSPGFFDQTTKVRVG